MTSQFDMSQYLGVFLDETEEQLQEMDQAILLLEQDRNNTGLLNKIFRAAHTIKGSSASMGFDEIATLTHDMENVLDKLRHQELEVSREIIDLLLACLDHLRVLKNRVASSVEVEVDVNPLIRRLKAAASQELAPVAATIDMAPAVELDDVEQNVVRAAEVKGYRVYHVAITIEPGCLMKSARAYIVFNNLKDIGEVIKTIPSTEEIEAEKFEDRFELVIITREDADTVANVVKSISEIAAVTVTPVTLEGESDSAAGKSITEDGPAELKADTGSGERQERKLAQTVRVDVQRLENLMNLVGELVIDRGRLAQVGSHLKNRLGSVELVETLEEVSVHIGRITGDLQEEIMKARMFPIEQVFNRFPRMVRDLAQKAGKEVDFVVEGRETELDRTVIEEIGDPLIHLLRNAIDHGIETPEERLKAGKPRHGTVKLRASHQENQIVITVEDDGRGISTAVLKKKAVEKGLLSMEAAARLSEREALGIIFLPGFSTARAVSDVSGRGVGMDIVRAHIERINGTVDTETTGGRGTRFTIKLPLTLAINRSLLVYVGDQVLAFPLANVVEIINVERSQVQRVQQREVVLVRGQVLPLFRLDRVLGFGTGEVAVEKFPVVVVGISERRLGFIVDTLIGEQEIVIKSLGDYIGQVPGLAGATIMGDGRVALILDIRGLVGQTGMDKAYDFAG
ncbi:chemotaxis protein CheA [Clostridiales bacterium PH28_bin88]|nr:chemotaxis protein CheA [Clostridiales bacterium PH28_bin88]